MSREFWRRRRQLIRAGKKIEHEKRKENNDALLVEALRVIVQERCSYRELNDKLTANGLDTLHLSLIIWMLEAKKCICFSDDPSIPSIGDRAILPTETGHRALEAWLSRDVDRI